MDDCHFSQGTLVQKDNHDGVQTLKEITNNIFGMQRNMTSNKSL
jgi:hypothetical protein